MSADNKTVFYQEQATLEEAIRLLNQFETDKCIPLDRYATIVIAYAELLKQISLLTRLGDKQDKRLNNLRERISRYVSPPIYRKITTGKEKAEINKTKRVKLTIFFSDIKGFSWHSSDMEGEAISEILNSYLEEMTKLIAKHGGTLDKYIGDAILVFFGDPDFTDDYDHARRCIAMALDMRQRMKELQQQWFHRGYQYPLHIRMGISTGYVSVGNFGSQERMDYTIIGAPVNLAARLQEVAKEDQILISHETWGFVKDIVRCYAAASLELKGFHQPQLTYEVIDYRDPEISSETIFEDKTKGVYLKFDSTKLTRAELIDILKQGDFFD